MARFHLYAQGVDVWVAPTLATGDAWVATMRHVAREGRMFVIGVNPCIHASQIPESLPRPDLLYPAEDREREGGWLLPGNTLIVDPTGAILAGPVEEEERIVTAELDLGLVRPSDASSIRSGTTTAPTSSARPSTPHRDLPS